ncbi:hypothetical protein [Microseira wollei]|uniref:Uncharacterized protein n=1 Tax=Microseira wollei NIES-4236 TaxID=2530354 RepID=A0AAV3XS07_9CYAN|nr:hypothetical protein [Microseira wollei]GET44623.1 hypothetical protein MiSe_94540 [Microseira wollei NIES-4236]
MDLTQVQENQLLNSYLFGEYGKLIILPGDEEDDQVINCQPFLQTQLNFMPAKAGEYYFVKKQQSCLLECVSTKEATEYALGGSWDEVMGEDCWDVYPG